MRGLLVCTLALAAVSRRRGQLAALEANPAGPCHRGSDSRRIQSRHGISVPLPAPFWSGPTEEAL